MPASEHDPAAELVIRTVGHGTLAAEAFAALVTGAGIDHVVDVRSHPGSRRHPHFGRGRMESWLPAEGVAYSWEPRLGGRRRPSADSEHVALGHEAFRAYADHMGAAEFFAGLDAVVTLAAASAPGTVAVMCAESLWWRCHRRLLADALVLLRGARVEHVLPDGRLGPHRPLEAARVEGDRLVYDVGVTGQPG